MSKHNRLTSAKGFRKFLTLLAILVAYGVFVVLKFGLKDGISATLLTWAFFVTCTPIADAGFIVDFPVRVVVGFKMIYSEIIVWVVAGLIIFGSLAFNEALFDKLHLFRVFKTILLNPWPLWSIILISCAGTFISLHIGDQIYNLVQDFRDKKRIKKLRLKRIGIEGVLFVLIVGWYFILLNLTGIKIG
ncbi:hypothetical protein KC960_02990 [Candidatus Saccharibacteria bacterium]|nr:hypothetical protein [Candidatus Saccharibacteria bacterium]